MNFDLKHIPFSRYGSYLSISYLPARENFEEGIYLRNIRGGDNEDGAVFKLDVTQDGKCVPFKSIGHPTYLQLEAEDGYVKIVMSEAGTMHVFGGNAGLRMTMVTQAYDNAFPHKEESWQINIFSKKIRFMLTPQIGSLVVDAPWHVNRCSHVIAEFIPEEKTKEFTCTIEEFITVYIKQPRYNDFETCQQIVAKEYEEWKDNVLPSPNKYEEGRKLASYITWSCIVNPEGNLTRPAMYMSKNWMTNIWSWDHCFNAMALAENNPALAWDQFMIFFDKQDPSGLLPDYMNDQYAYWNCSKPPIHGWTLSWMLKRSTKISKDHLKEVYGPLSKWTTWYLEHRDDNANGFPEYHHGNDSGWDNSTVFHEGIPVESPDLCAFLILQMETLADIAETLNLNEEARTWKEAADKLLHDMIEHFWVGDRFVAHYLNEQGETGDSLLLFMPIILGKRLPLEIRTKLIDGLKDKSRFFTAHGLATESIKSPYYIPDGYWRGPIWAPSTMLLIDGLVASGEVDFAQDLARRYCEMATKNGMAENFDALTGEGLRDRAFTWTSSVFLVLSNEYC
ncbi:amylo-alpha-1,6-glucosidase [Sporosarcina limicola]|uniref:Glycogen debranching enzyme n=1 Tax=Sporosarcina limicola TaxID=34101 RepID=A0A927R5Q6_9BACL|nr:trehalase family glycosidase [Sporosarcina limicola]MBE1556323.1 glycogen debranching enzyme [Sporosarcina limicola]